MVVFVSGFGNGEFIGFVFVLIGIVDYIVIGVGMEVVVVVDVYVL